MYIYIYIYIYFYNGFIFSICVFKWPYLKKYLHTNIIINLLYLNNKKDIEIFRGSSIDRDIC